MSMLSKHRTIIFYIFLLIAITLLFLYSSTIITAFVDKVFIGNNKIFVGTLYNRGTITHKFYIWNLSFHKRKIAYVQPSCSCSVINKIKPEIARFQCTEIEISTDTTNLESGYHRKAITILFDDGEEIQEPIFFSFNIASQ